MERKNFNALLEHIIRLNKVVSNAMKSNIKDIGISDLSPTQAILLLFISENKFGLLELANNYFLPNIPYNIKQMKKYGYIKQEKSKYDKRAYEITLSKKGVDALNKLQMEIDKYLLNYEKFLTLSFGDLISSMQQLEDLFKHSKAVDI
ncbi:hypothetical protein FZC35_00930 [Candidatus Cytomitobacter indipagum]|uniref:MarR family transcriptional regulator n=1 Tax=Candidatus Cytomitobacter indipagum TaxID=2601575 RepID=A0A5C0UD44_9PROT|nr:hypothetical protein [Candidatus Cytomitobacter indipagum]QEK37945.1 hypothetical protein FZC35_00930 [Candidatus Cytomitobacter indipagum]